MDEHIDSVLTEFLDTETKFHDLNSYYQTMIDTTAEEEYGYKLECLYEWWQQEETYTSSQWFNE